MHHPENDRGEGGAGGPGGDSAPQADPRQPAQAETPKDTSPEEEPGPDAQELLAAAQRAIAALRRQAAHLIPRGQRRDQDDEPGPAAPPGPPQKPPQ